MKAQVGAYAKVSLSVFQFLTSFSVVEFHLFNFNLLKSRQCLCETGEC